MNNKIIRIATRQSPPALTVICKRHNPNPKSKILSVEGTQILYVSQHGMMQHAEQLVEERSHVLIQQGAITLLNSIPL